MYKLLVYSDELYHYGVLGMRWGVRRYQNYDGTKIKGGPVTNPKHAGHPKSVRDTVAGGQGGKAEGNEKLAANTSNKPSAKDVAKKLTTPSVKQGKGREDISPAEDITKKAKRVAESGERIAEFGEKHDKSVQQKNEEARQKQMNKAKKMSDKELRDSINRIKMEREYTSLTTKETESGWTKAKEILSVSKEVLEITGVVVGIIASIMAIKKGMKQSDISDDVHELNRLLGLYEFDDDFIAHAMDLDEKYLMAAYDISEEDVDYYLEHHGVKGMRWGVRRYQNYDGTRISTGTPNLPNPSSLGGGVGSGAGGGGGGGHRADSNPVFQKRRRQKAIESFKNSVAGGQGGKAVGNERLAAKVIPDNETSKYKSSDTQKAVDAWKKHDDIHWNKVDPARDQYFKLKERYGENDKRTKAAQETMIKAIEESDKYAKIAVDKFKNIPYDDIDDDVLRIGQHSATWKYDVKVEDIDKYNGPTIDRWSSSKQDFESYKFESTNPNVEILGDAPGGEIALRRRPKKSDPIADAKAAKDREDALARSEVQDLKDAYRLTGDRSYLKAAKDKEKQLKRR